MQHLGSGVYGVRDLLLQEISLPRGMQRPEHHAFCCPWTNPELLDLASELLDEIVGHAVEDVEALYGQTRLAAVEEPPHARGARGLIKICVVANDHGIRAPELERGAL